MNTSAPNYRKKFCCFFDVTVWRILQCQWHAERFAMKQLTSAGMRKTSGRQVFTWQTCLHSYFQSAISLLKLSHVQVSDPSVVPKYPPLSMQWLKMFWRVYNFLCRKQILFSAHRGSIRRTQYCMGQIRIKIKSSHVELLGFWTLSVLQCSTDSTETEPLDERLKTALSSDPIE